jgi:cation diffusion facilitator CzcD-associated flavoprotein CzcO
LTAARMREKPAFIIGGGMAGLAAAGELLTGHR